MASKSNFYGGTNSYVRGVDKSISDLIQMEVKKNVGSVQNKLLSLTQRVDLMNTNFEEYKRTAPSSIKGQLQECKEDILNEMSGLMEKFVNEVQGPKATKKRRRVPRELTVSGLCRNFEVWPVICKVSGFGKTI